MNALRRSCRTQLVADAFVVAVLSVAQIVLLYLLWMKDRFFVPPELLIASFIETVLVTLLLQLAAFIQLSLLVWGLFGFCAHRVKFKGDTGFRLDGDFIRDLFFGVLYVPLCLGGAFLTAAASRPWHTEPFEGGIEIFSRIVPLVLVILLVILGIYIIYRGSQSPLLQFPPHLFPVGTRYPAATRDDLIFIITGLLLLPLYALLAVYPRRLFALLNEPQILTVVDIVKLRSSITCIAASLTGSGILVLFCAMAIQTCRRRTSRGVLPLQREISLDIMHGP